MNFYPRYIGDYQRDTSRLSIMEHGAYALLLDDYYGQERPLPADLSELYRICRATTTKEREAVQSVARQFFPIDGDGLRHNGRADEEIQKAHERIEAARKNGRNGGRPPKPSDNPVANPAETQWQSSPTPSPETTTSPSSTREALVDFVVAANTGLAEHVDPRMRIAISRIGAHQETAQTATAEILKTVPQMAAKRIIYDLASTCKHDGKVSSLGFFTERVKKAYADEQAVGVAVDRSGKRSNPRQAQIAADAAKLMA